jgi:hypothetical protein
MQTIATAVFISRPRLQQRQYKTSAISQEKVLKVQILETQFGPFLVPRSWLGFPQTAKQGIAGQLLIHNLDFSLTSANLQ